MLVELMVENFAVVERVRVRFGAGLNLLTGETGSGKSIVVDSLGLLFGGRASADMVRTGTERARVAGIFELPQSKALASTLEAAGIAPEDGELLIEREVLANGKSRAFAGGRPVTAAVLRELAAHLGDIHGQHDQQRLFSGDTQLEILDEFARAGDLRERTGAAYREWRAAARELEALEKGDQEKLQLLDLWRFQKKEIEAAGLKAGEEQSLDQERRVLANATKLQEGASAAYEALYEAPDAALARLGTVRRRMDEIARLDNSLDDVRGAIEPAAAALNDAAAALRDYLGALDADPGRLDAVESRIAAIEKLRRKYGSTTEEILAFLADVTAKLDAVENVDAHRGRLKKDLDRLAAAYEMETAALRQLRRAAAAKLEKKVQKELAELAMAGTVFRIVFTDAGWTESGIDAMAFLIAPNAGEEPKPLEKIASGGELSRLALALKTSAEEPRSAKGSPRVLVFDEVDTGIGGATAEAVGRRLKRLAAASQVLCVTHLAQIASFADQHYRVEKREVKGRTAAEIEELTGDNRTREVGRMLSGQRVTDEALRHAEKLIRTSK
jgi:DNA repair protein RecN (Recombination protein N)